MSAEPWAMAVAAILRGVPRLDGALCRDRNPEVFDVGTDEDAERAAAVCRRCPALQACGAWAAGLKHNEANGVLAGQLRVWVSHPSERRTRGAART